MKRAIYLAAAAVACLSLSACATTSGHVSAAVEAVTSPAADAAAVKVEATLATLITSFDLVVSDPSAKVDRVKLASVLSDAADLLGEARALFDERGGGVSALAGRAVGLIAQAVPEGASTSARFAIGLALGGLQTYAASIDVKGLAIEPSDALVQARERTDDALRSLRNKLPPPGS